MPLSNRIAECGFPPGSAMDRRWIEQAFFRDSYRFPITGECADPVAVFHAVFGHHPWYFKAALLTRNFIAGLFGLAVPSASAVLRPASNKAARVGEAIGAWPLFALAPRELVAGRDNKHLDFRLSVLIEVEDRGTFSVISTACVVHNWFGRIYLCFVVPFHKWGVRRLIVRALAAGRL
ncbi:MAG: DUF2867 domain-containing protein [Pseudomonadota bacterium]